MTVVFSRHIYQYFIIPTLGSSINISWMVPWLLRSDSVLPWRCAPDLQGHQLPKSVPSSKERHIQSEGPQTKYLTDPLSSWAKRK